MVLLGCQLPVQCLGTAGGGVTATCNSVNSLSFERRREKTEGVCLVIKAGSK
jgi:hypothetical protein